VGYKHTREEILEGAVAVAFAEGLSALTFGNVAKRLDTSDRIVVYYFPSKDEMVSAVLGSLGVQLQTTLAASLPSVSAGHLELVRGLWPALANAEADAVFAVFFEAVGLAASGREPYRTVVPVLVRAWIDWTTGFISGPPAHRRAEAETAIALLDGLLLLRQLMGPDTANRAARRLMAPHRAATT